MAGENDFYGGGKNQSLQRVIPLGVGSVTTQTRTVGTIPRNCRVKKVKFHGQGAVTAAVLTAMVVVRDAEGGNGENLLTAAADIDFATAAAARVGVEGIIDASEASIDEDQLLECVITATTATAGPGDLVVEVEFAPRYQA